MRSDIRPFERPSDARDEFPRVAAWATTLVRLLGALIRVPLLALLIAIEPIVRVILLGAGMLGVLMSVFFEFVIHAPRFPFMKMLGISIACIMVLQLFELACLTLSRPSK